MEESQQIKPIILSDVGGTLLDRDCNVQNPLGKKLMELKENSDVYMATDGENGYAKSVVSILKYGGEVPITFTGIITKDTFGFEKNTNSYWNKVIERFGKNLILVDDNDRVLDTAQKNNITTVKATADSADTAARLDETYKKVIAQLNA